MHLPILSPTQTITAGHGRDPTLPATKRGKVEVDVLAIFGVAASDHRGIGSQSGFRLCGRPSQTNLLHERVEALDSNCNLSEAATVGMIDILGKHKVLTV